MPLTPILRRTFAIFRERPLLFTAVPLILLIAASTYPSSFDGHSFITKAALITGAFLLVCAGLPLIYAFVIALTLEAEETSSISLARAWNRVWRQAGLAGTAFMIEVFFIGVPVLMFIVAALINLIPGSSYSSSLAIGQVLAVLLMARVMVPVALAMPLVLIQRSSTTILALDESWRLARGIFWPITAAVFLQALPAYLFPYLGAHFHFSASISTPAARIGNVFLLIVEAICNALSFIALTLIALNRFTADQQQKTLPATNAAPHSPAQVVIL